MNPFRIWALISQGVLRVIERFFGGLPTSGSLMAHVQTHLGPTETIRQDELTTLTEIVQRGIASARVVERGGVMSEQRIPEIPSVSNVGLQSYKSIVEVTIGGETKRFPVTVNTNRSLNLAELRSLNEQAINDMMPENISREYLEWLRSRGQESAVTQSVISLYKNVGIGEWQPYQ